MIDKPWIEDEAICHFTLSWIGMNGIKENTCMVTSFISEHSTEYALVPQFIKILMPVFSKVTPIYFWATREGSNMNKDSYKRKLVRIVTLYARRPKIEEVNSKYILMTINPEIYNRVDYLENNGIPVFAGIPLVSSLVNFSILSRCAWIYLSSSTPHSEIKFTIDKFEGIFEDEIIEIVRDRTIPMEWRQAVKIMKNNIYEVGNQNFYRSFGRSLFGERYKPVYFVIVD